MGTELFINSSYTVNQNANLYGSNLNDGNATYDYDYIFQIHLNSFASNITSIFTNATFKQLSNNTNDVEINLTIADSVNFTNFNSVFDQQNIVTVVNSGGLSSTFSLKSSALEKIGDRLLEVVAHKLFGHGQARAAIKNDPAFYEHDGDIWNHLTTTLQNSNIQHDIFNQYVATGRYNSTNATYNNDLNDLDTYENFNFNGLTFGFPLWVNGNLELDTASLSASEIATIQNGPNVGGTSLLNGQYNIPILIQFTQEP
jgi:hypothetical protein